MDRLSVWEFDSRTCCAACLYGRSHFRLDVVIAALNEGFRPAAFALPQSMRYVHTVFSSAFSPLCWRLFLVVTSAVPPKLKFSAHVDSRTASFPLTLYSVRIPNDI